MSEMSIILESREYDLSGSVCSNAGEWIRTHQVVLLIFLKKNASSPAQYVSKQSLSQPINICDDSDYNSRTEKRLPWTKEEDLVLVSYFLLANGLYVDMFYIYSIVLNPN
jgi:hypothetical protein